MRPIIPIEKTFARVFFKKSKKNFCEIFSFLVHFSLDKRNFRDSCIFHLTSENFCDSCIFHLTSENFCDSCIFSLDTIAKLCPSKFGVFPPFHDSIYYYHLLDLPLQMLQVLYTFQSLPKYYYLWVIHYYHTFY